MLAYRLDGMKEYAVAFDLETHLIQPGLLAPPIVLGSASELGPHGIQGVLLDKTQARAVFRTVLADGRIIVCVANGPYDFLCMAVDAAQFGEDLMPGIFNMYDPEGTIVYGYCDGRVFEVQLAEPLHAIAQGHHGKHAISGEPILNDHGRKGRYSLRAVTKEVKDRDDAKVNDQFRLSFYQFDNKPFDELPFEARQYPVDDTNNTLDDALSQAGHLPSANMHVWADGAEPGRAYCRHCHVERTPTAPAACMRLQARRNLHDLSRQAYFAWAAHLGAAWGFSVPQKDVDALEKKYLDMREANSAPFIKAGIIRENGTEDQSVLKRLVAVAYGARDLCTACNGTRKVPSPKTNGKTKINCAACDGTGLALPRTVPRSDGGGISKDHDTLQESGDELLMLYAEQEGKKILSTYIPLLRKGRACTCCGRTGAKTKYTPAHEDWCTQKDNPAYREVRILPSVDPLKDTGRAAIEGGLHGLPRKGGVRECIQATPGYVLSSEDYQAGELVTVSWICRKIVGYSQLGDILNKGLDAHLDLAGTILGKPYDEMVRLKKLHDTLAIANRQAAKPGNFGFWGGMAELTFTLNKRSDKDLWTPCPNGPDVDDKGNPGYNGLRLCVLMGGYDRCGYVKITEYNDKPCPPVCKACVEYAKQLRKFWLERWREAQAYFDWVKKQLRVDGPSGTPELTHLQSNRVRGGLGFCDGANGLFQGLLADAAKNAFCQIQRECVDRTVRVRSSQFMTSKFDGCESPLLGSRAIALFHDEAVCEHPESIAHEAATRTSEILVESLRFMCPEQAPSVFAHPTIMRRLYKGAEPRYARGGDKPADENDRLVCWEPN